MIVCIYIRANTNGSYGHSYSIPAGLNHNTTASTVQYHSMHILISYLQWLGIFIIQGITIQRPGIHRRWRCSSANGRCSSSGMAITLDLFLSELFIDMFSNRVAVLIHRDNSSAGAGDSLLRLQWKQTPLCVFETDVVTHKPNGFT